MRIDAKAISTAVLFLLLGAQSAYAAPVQCETDAIVTGVFKAHHDWSPGAEPLFGITVLRSDGVTVRKYYTRNTTNGDLEHAKGRALLQLAIAAYMSKAKVSVTIESGKTCPTTTDWMTEWVGLGLT